MIAVTMVRDEADIVGYTIEHLLAEGVDRVVVADNLSVDGTRAILDGWAQRDSRVTVVDDDDPGYHQARKMTALAAHAYPGEWVIPFDADELWTNLDQLTSEANVAYGHPLVHVPGPGDDPADPNPYTRIRRHRPLPEGQPKVAFRYTSGAAIDIGNHGVRGVGGPTSAAVLDIRHFQYRTLAQTARKVRQGVAALDAGRLPEVFGSHWRRLGALDDEALAGWWDGYTRGEMTLEGGWCELVDDPAPWRSCRASLR